MSLFEDTNPKKLSDLLGEIHSRTTALPDFQRDFVWEPSATQELIVSIANNYPAGSLLRVRDQDKLFAAREFEGAPVLSGYTHTFLVLDGQQRLTSLFQAFYGVGEHRYFVNLHKLMVGMDFEDTIFHLRSGNKWVKEHDDFDAQRKDLMIPLSLLKSGSGGFLEWIFDYTNGLPDENKVPTQKTLRAISDRWFKVIDEYQFPVVTLSSDVKPDALCTIFETLNRTGVKLSVFELLTARFWPYKVNLRTLWDQAIGKHPIIKEYEVDPYYLLQAISLASRPSPSCKRSEVLNLKASEINDWWSRVVEGFATGLKILRDDCRVVAAKWLPYQTMILPLAAVLAKLEPTNTPESGSRRQQLKRWFWCSVFGQQYESSPNSQAAKDVSELVAWLKGGAEPESITSMKFDPNMLRDTTPRQRAIYRGTICLVLGCAGGARDFHSQALITGNLIEQEGIDDHHIFPASYLEKQKGVTDSKRRDCVLNRTLIDRATNQLISDRAPSDYLTQIKNTPNFPFDTILKSHCLPTADDSPLLTDDFEAFLTWRQKELWKEIQRVTGLKDAAVLEAILDCPAA
jgi:hypothetical protein